MIAIVDVETTGHIPEIHGITQIGAATLTGAATRLGNPSTFFCRCRPRPSASVDLEALKIAGITFGELVNRELPTEYEAVKRFLDWASRFEITILGGHNVHFDVSFLSRSALSWGFGWPFSYRVLDLHSIVLFHCLNVGSSVEYLEDLSLDRILVQFSLPPRNIPHDALSDALAVRRVLYHLLASKESADEAEKEAQEEVWM